MNESVISLFGYAENELIGHPVSIIFMPDDTPNFEQVEVFSSDEKVFRQERICKNKKGENIQVLLSATKVISDDKNSSLNEFICIILDITKQKKLETELLQAQKLESIGSLASGIAHEINTPMQYINDSMQFITDAFKKMLELYEIYQNAIVKMDTIPQLKATVKEIRELEKR